MADTYDQTGVRQPDAGLIAYTHIIYALHASAVLTGVLTGACIAGRFVFGLPSVIAEIMDYARLAQARGTWLETHFRWQTRPFWVALLWNAITLHGGAPRARTLFTILI